MENMYYNFVRYNTHNVQGIEISFQFFYCNVYFIITLSCCVTNIFNTMSFVNDFTLKWFLLLLYQSFNQYVVKEEKMTKFTFGLIIYIYNIVNNNNKINNLVNQVSMSLFAQLTVKFSQVHFGKTRLYKLSKTVSCDFNCPSNMHFI